MDDTPFDEDEMLDDTAFWELVLSSIAAYDTMIQE